MPEIEDRYRRYSEDLRASGVRMTRPRQTILRVLAEAQDHPDASELFRRSHAIDDRVSLSTVYRTLRLLEIHGVIQRHAFDQGRSRFENADGEHHDHLIDIESGEVIEFRSDKIEQLQAEIARSRGYEIVRHRLELYVRKCRPQPPDRLGAARPGAAARTSRK